MFTGFQSDGVIWSDGNRERVDAVIFATGFRPNVAYLSGLDALDQNGLPLHRKGVSTAVPGLFFVGLPEQRSYASATVRGVGRDAAYLMPSLIRHIRRATASGATRV